MKKTIITLSLFFSLSSYSFAENWHEKWSEAVLLIDKGDFIEGTSSLEDAISLMEESNEDQDSSLYTDLARLNFMLGNNEESLASINKGLTTADHSNQEKIRALITKILLSGRIGPYDLLFSQLNTLKQLVDLPVMKVNGKIISMRNTPDNDYYKKMMSCFLIHSGLCYDLEEISWLKSGTLIANTHCGCPNCLIEYAKTRECDVCHHLVSPTQTNGSLDDFTVAAVQYFAKEVKQLEDQKACLIALCQIREQVFSMELFSDTFEATFQEIEKPVTAFFD